MERIAPLDAAFLRLETPQAHMHVGWLARLAPPPGGGPLDVDRLRDGIAARLHLVPRLRRRATGTHWEDDPEFDLQRHVVVADDHGAWSQSDLHALSDDVLSRPLDRSRPLWELVVVPELKGGGAALVGKIHHAVVDGVAAVELGMVLFDLEPSPSRELPVPWRPAPAVGQVRRAVDTAADSALEQFRLVQGAARAGLSPRRTVRLADTMRRTALSMAEGGVRLAPRSHLNVSLGARRTLKPVRVDIGRLLAVKRATGTKLNDVVLALVALALRRHAVLCGERPEPLRVMVPVNMRPGGAAGSPAGNRITFGFVDLPLDEPSASRALARIHEQTSALKRSGLIEVSDLLLRAVGRLPGPLQGRAAQVAASPRLYNVTVSNVPGPRVPLYAAGARVEEIFPVIPLAEGHVLSVGVLTYGDGAHVGLYADPHAVDELHALPGLIAEAVRRLERATLHPRPDARPRRRRPAPAPASTR